MGINKDLGLPFGDGMEKVAVCFDVEGTLINGDTETYHDTLHLLRHFLAQRFKNVDIIVWSGGGAKYAETQYNRITMVFSNIVAEPKFHSKLEYEALKQKYAKIIAFDDVQDTRLGDVNLIVRNK